MELNFVEKAKVRVLKIKFDEKSLERREIDLGGLKIFSKSEQNSLVENCRNMEKGGLP